MKQDTWAVKYADVIMLGGLLKDLKTVNNVSSLCHIGQGLVAIGNRLIATAEAKRKELDAQPARQWEEVK